ncbi:MAG: alpha amylase catalytic region, partial [Paenibacillus sp.]|nr:alpha amylase catalytic region [Paenibacillus sp.]
MWTANGPSVVKKTTVYSSSGNGGGGSSPTLNPAVNQVSVNEFNALAEKAGTSKNINIDLNKDDYILLPGNAGELLQQAQKGAVITSGGISLEIPSAVLNSLSKLLSGDEAKDAQIKVSLKAIESADTNALVEAANQASGALIKQNGNLYEFDLTVETKDGKSFRLDGFNEPITLRFKLDSNGSDTSLLGIYYFNESLKQWDYIGGNINAANGTIEALLSHNSKYAVLEYKKTYTDVPSTHWAYDPISALSAKHVIEGVTSKEFGPDRATTRAQFVTLLIRALGIPNTGGQSNYIDVAKGQWYSEAVEAAVHAGIVNGIDDTHFAPNAAITREQMAVLLVRAYEYKKDVLLKSSDKLTNYEDAKEISTWAKEEVNKAVNAGFMQGRGEGRFVPDAVTTRAETAKAIYNVLDK